MKPSIQFYAGRFMAALFAEKLPADRLFHNFQHTVNVVRGVRDIAKNMGLDKDQKEILLLAAWFHDSGHTICYQGHEMESQKIATDFLRSNNYPEEKLKLVVDCIGATQMPQNPTTLLQRVICDADLYHLSLLEYISLQFMLREEWKRILLKEFTQDDWQKMNLQFLENHRYFTTYGQEVLEKRKKENIECCKGLRNIPN